MAASSPGSAGADPTKVVFYLDGGGICTDATTCAFTGTAGENESYNSSVVDENAAFPGAGSSTPTGPTTVRRLLGVHVPSCTGDLYLGDVP